MRWLNSKVSTVGIFFAATALLITYLLSMRWHIYLPVALYWLAISLMVGTIVYQSLEIKSSSAYAKAVLLEITVASLVFHLIYQIPFYGLYGTDVYADMTSLKSILSSGFVLGDPQYTNTTGFYPMIHILGAQLSLITNIGLFSIVKWFPSLLSIAFIPLLYLFVRSVFKEEKIALLSALLFACLQPHILFSSLFIRQTIALVLMVGCIYFCFSAKSSAHPGTYYALSITCLAGTVFAHHLTAFMLALFLLIHLLVARACELPFLRRTYFGDNITGEKISTSFLTIAFVALLGYSIHVIISPLYNLVSFAKELFSPTQWGVGTYGYVAGIAGAEIQTMRGYIIFYGFFSFVLIFGAILLYQLLRRAGNRRAEIYSFTLFLFLCGIVGFIQLYVVPMGGAPFPDRFLTFGWLFGFAPLVAAILNGKYKWLRRVGVCLLVSYMVFNLYMIPPTVWDPKADGVASATSREDYALANTFDFSGVRLAAHPNPRMAIYNVHNNMGGGIFGNVELSEYDWVIVQKEVLRRMKQFHPEAGAEATAKMEELMKEGSPERNRIYDSTSLSVFKRRNK